MSHSYRDPDLFVAVFSTVPSIGLHIVDAQDMLVVPWSHGEEGQAFQKGLHMKWSFRGLSET